MMKGAFYYGMTPSEFWDTPPGEINAFIHAQHRAERAGHEMHAHFTACIMNVWSKRRIRGSQLLGNERKSISHFGGSIKAAKEWAIANADKISRNR